MNVTTKCEPVRAGNVTGTVVTAPGTVPSAIGGTVTSRVWVPEVMVKAVGTEWRPSAITCMLSPVRLCGLARS